MLHGNAYLPDGIRSRYNASTFVNKTEWNDKYGIQNAKNIGGGETRLVTKQHFVEIPGGIPKSKGFPYVAGDTNSQWNLTETFEDNNWTVAYISRYDPSGGPYRRIFDIRNSNTFFGHWSGVSGLSFHDSPVGEWKGIGDPLQWIFAIEQPKRHLVRGGKDKNWVDKRGGQNIKNVELTIMNGKNNHPEFRSNWNIAEIIYWDKTLNNTEVAQVMAYFNDYADGKIDVLTTDRPTHTIEMHSEQREETNKQNIEKNNKTETNEPNEPTHQFLAIGILIFIWFCFIYFYFSTM